MDEALDDEGDGIKKGMDMKFLYTRKKSSNNSENVIE